MCGIFGFITNNGAGPDLDRLARIARATETRGRHASGLAWIASDGRIQTWKEPGPFSTHLGRLAPLATTDLLIGHCRYATHGPPEDNRNNHPHPAGSGWLVHNGIITNYTRLVAQHRLATRTDCDSEALGLLMARHRGSIGRRAAMAVEAAAGPLAILGIWRNPARLLIVRRGRPLHYGEAREGFYFASLPTALPGRPWAIPDNYACVMTHGPEGLTRQETWEILPELPEIPF